MMEFVDISALNDHYLMVKYLVCGYEAVDCDNQLALYTTKGRVHNTRKWFVVRYLLPSGKPAPNAPRMQFRATNLEAALEWLKQERNQKRIREVLQI